jgi:hypothetical protein
VKVWVYHGDEIPQAEQETERLRARALVQAATGGGASTGALITDEREAAEITTEPAAPVVPTEPAAEPTTNGGTTTEATPAAPPAGTTTDGPAAPGTDGEAQA